MRPWLGNLLVKSPLSRLTEIMDRVVACSDLVPELIDQLIAGDQPGVRETAREISRLESLADEAKNGLRNHMPHRLFLPVDRRDVLTLVHHMDSIADDAEDVAVVLTMRELQVPAPMKPLLVKYCEQVRDTVHAARVVIAEFPGLFHAGFSGNAARNVQALVKEINLKEHEADRTQEHLAGLLFEQEENLTPAEILLWSKVLNKIGDMADHAENVGDHFRLFLAR
jgi:predicted phosphate transport protein (TIGR00153 family)